MTGTTKAGTNGYREHRYTAQDGLSLYYREYGDPQSPRLPLLCLAGLSRNSKDHHDVALRLSKRHRVICPDYRGRGRSDYDPDWRRYHPATYINDLKHLMTLARLHHVVIIGTSMGGLLAMGLAVAAPTAVAGAILNDVGPNPDPAGLARIVDYIGTDRPQPDFEAAAAMLKEALPDLNLGKDENWLKLAHQTYRQGDDGQLHFDWDTNIARPFKERPTPLPDLWAVFRALGRVPVLAIRGALSDVLRADTLERMKAELPHLIAITIAGKGHAPTLTEPASVKAIDAFLARPGDA